MWFDACRYRTPSRRPRRIFDFELGRLNLSFRRDRAGSDSTQRRVSRQKGGGLAPIADRVDAGPGAARAAVESVSGLRAATHRSRTRVGPGIGPAPRPPRAAPAYPRLGLVLWIGNQSEPASAGAAPGNRAARRARLELSLNHQLSPINRCGLRHG